MNDANWYSLKGIGGLVGVVLAAALSAAVVLYYQHKADQERIGELQSQVGVLREHEKQANVDRRVSKQMEEIAYGQQTLSEERSQEAIRQSEIAQKMTLRSEAERRNALEAQGIAEMAAKEALNAYQMAERQRVEAEHAKLVADTLNYVSLGRTLGSQSYSIYQAGDTELGTMLAYAAYLYTSDYGGDLYVPAVFQAMTQAAMSRRSWSVHNGSIARIYISPTDSRLLTVSTYGEIFTHTTKNGQLATKRVFSNKDYCFRDVYAASDKDYALSHTGHLVVVGEKQAKVIFLEGIDKPFSLQHVYNGTQLFIVGESSYAMLDTKTDRIIGTRRMPFRVTCTSRRDHNPLLFDDRGGMHMVKSIDDVTDEKVPFAGQVTAFASSKNEHLSAYGMSDGTIWLADNHGRTRKLVGHLSQVTNLKFDGRRLYSSSYDGKLLFWLTGDQQIKPITLFQSGSWLTDFTFSPNKNCIWTGEHNGTITEYLVSLPVIADRLRQNIKRNFTQEEWNYYVGKAIEPRKIKE